MIKIENVETHFKNDIMRALENINAKGYRKTAGGKYETFISDNSKSISLGTYDTITDATAAVNNFKFHRFVEKVSAFEKNIYDGKVYKDKYVVYPSGNIYNLCGKRMEGGVNKDGYRQGVFDGKNIQWHRIVAELFIPNPYKKKCVNHRDGNKQNNNVDNLEWCTHSENTIHAYINELEKKCIGEQHHNHKLTDDNVRFIRNVYKKGSRYSGAAALSLIFGVDRTTVQDVVDKKTWRHIV